MRTKTKPKPHPPRFTVLDLPAHPDHPEDCVHAKPRHLANVEGWPICADCRAVLKARAAAAPPPAPEPWQQDALVLAAADRAAGAHLED